MIGGNITGSLQLKTGTTKNEIGEKVPTWTTIHSLRGWLDLSSGDSKYSSYDAKIQESTHVFICDYIQFDDFLYKLTSDLILDDSKTYYTRSGSAGSYVYTVVKTPDATMISTYYEREQIEIKAENSRMVVNGRVYDVMLIDNPMEMNKHLEIYLKYTGGQ